MGDLQIAQDSSTGQLKATFNVQYPVGTKDYIFVEQSTDLKNWVAAGVSPAGTNTAGGLIINSYSIPVCTTNKQMFFRASQIAPKL